MAFSRAAAMSSPAWIALSMAAISRTPTRRGVALNDRKPSLALGILQAFYEFRGLILRQQGLDTGDDPCRKAMFQMTGVLPNSRSGGIGACFVRT
jgi:hypothetical protein